MQNALRPAFKMAGSFILTALIIVLFVFTALKVAGAHISVAWIGRIVMGNFGHSQSTSEPVLKAFLERLPATLELIVASVIIGAVTGWAIAALSTRAPRSIRVVIANLALVLQCIPFFGIAFAAEALIAILSRNPHAFGMAAFDYFDLRDRLLHLAFPALTLALIQIPAFAQCLSNDANANQVGEPKVGSILASLFVAFAERLPEVIGAAIITEILFAWPGDGRLFFYAIGQGDLNMLAGLVLFGAVSVLLVRSIAATLARPNMEIPSDA